MSQIPLKWLHSCSLKIGSHSKWRYLSFSCPGLNYFVAHTWWTETIPIIIEFILCGFFFLKDRLLLICFFFDHSWHNFQDYARVSLLTSFSTHTIFWFILLTSSQGTSSTKAQTDALNRLFRTYYVVLSGMRHCFCNNYIAERAGSSPCAAVAWDSTEAVNLQSKNFSWLTLLSQHSPNSSDWKKKIQKEPPAAPRKRSSSE